MCGRIAQVRSAHAYARCMGWDLPLPDEPIGHYNGSPGARHWTFRLTGEDRPSAEPVKWEYLSSWAEKKQLAPAINAKVEKLLTPYYRGLMKSGRIIVPAEGWFEWTGVKGNKQPWYIKGKTGEPLFFAALSSHRPEDPDMPGKGFVIVTDDAAGGMVDVHDRRPVALAADDVRLWMDPGTDYRQAEQAARTGLPEEYFEWYQVSREVNKTGNNNSRMIEPIQQ